MIDHNDPMLAQYTVQQNIETSPQQYQTTPTQQVPPMQNMAVDPSQSSGMENPGNQPFDNSFLDANDPTLFNFDLTGMNFGNHYGALEFGMLGHMSSGAVDTSDLENIGQLGGQSQHGSLSYDSSFNPTNTFNYNQYPGWQGVQPTASRQGSSTNIWTTQNNSLNAFAIGENNHFGQSPHSGQFDFSTDSQSVSPENQYVQIETNQQNDLLRQSMPQAGSQQHRKQIPQYTDPNQRKRRRDTSEIYSSVSSPYPYTQGFHALTAFLQKRFPSNKRLRIAKALASVRPSFISCNKNLNYDDLIFMEQSLQRTLFEYEDFTTRYGTPTIICRRTGEIAAVTKEFSLVTGWRSDVLLGKEPNLNVNTGSNPLSGTHTGASSRGAATPRIPNMEIDPGRPQPVFLAELMDEDSVVEFYEDFAELAFGASRTSIIKTCSLLKYKTKRDLGWEADDSNDDEKGAKRTASGETKREAKSKDGMHALGERDGRVDCAMCWTVKRDVFDIPMLIVMNVSYPATDPVDMSLLADILPVLAYHMILTALEWPLIMQYRRGFEYGCWPAGTVSLAGVSLVFMGAGGRECASLALTHFGSGD
jgi:hypothetical protein